MSTIDEIEAAIKELPPHKIDELAQWLDALRARRQLVTPVDARLERARGAATPGLSTSEIMSLTREE